MLIGCAVALVTPEGQAITRAWLGTAGNNWSTAANWSPTGPPQNGDDLVFTNKVSNNIVNDLTGLTVRSMYFSLDFDLSGNALTLTSGISDLTSGGVTLEFGGLTLGGDIYLDSVNSQLEVYCPIDLNGFTVTVSSYNNHWVDLDGIISNNGNIIVARGTNFIESFDGNDFTGLLQVQGGTVWLNSFNSFAINSAVDIWAGATVILLHDYQIDQGANVLIEPSGQLLLDGHTNRFSALEMWGGLLDSGPGGLIELMGRLQANATNQSPTVAGNLALEYDLFVDPPEFNVNGPSNPGLDVTANLLADGFSKTGLGLMRLAGVNSFVSGSTLWQGVVQADSNTAFGTGTVDMEGGAISLRNVTITGVPLNVGWPNALQLDGRYGGLLTAIGTCVWTGPITLGTNLFALVTGDLTLSGAITGAGGLSVWLGDAHLTGTAGNTFTGPLFVDCDILDFGKPSGINACAGPIVVGGLAYGGPFTARWLNPYQNVGANLTLYPNGIVNLNSHNEDFGNVTFNGGEVDTGNGQFAFYQTMTVNPTNVSAVINGYFGLPAGANRVIVVGKGEVDCDLIINAVAFGSPNYLVKQGPGTICMTGANSYNAVTLLEQGTLDINNSSGLGTWPGLVIFDGATLRLSGAGTGPGFEVLGAGVGGQGAVELVPSASWLINGGILMDGPTTFNVGASATLGLYCPISSSNPGSSVIKAGTGNLLFGGSSNNTYSGDTFVTAGSLVLLRPAGVTQIPHNVAIGNGPGGASATLLEQSSFSIIGSVMVNHTGLWDLTGQAEGFSFTTPPPITLNGNGSVQTGTNGIVYLPVGGDVIVNPGSNTTATISGNIGMDPGVHHFNVGSGATIPGNVDLNVNAVIGQTSTAAAIEKDGPGTLRLGATNSYTGTDVVSNGVMQVDGQRLTGPVQVSGGRLQGSGVVAALSMVSSTGTVSPGDGPGILTCGNFNAGVTPAGTLLMELDGLAPGTGYDQLNVRGSVNLTGITLDARLNFASSPGESFTIINNDGVDPITGTFNGLPQGASLFIGGELFQIAYTGGTGNDVVLTRLVTPPKPALTAQLLPNAIVLSWPTNDPLYGLQFSTNLPATNWTAASPPPVLVGSNFVVSNSLAGPFKVYRLKR